MDVCGREVVDALVVSLMIVMINECLDLRFEVCREEVVLQQDAVFQGLMPSLDLALCLRVIRCPPAVCRVCGFCLIFVPFGHYDEPEILPYAITLICPIGADVRHRRDIFKQNRSTALAEWRQLAARESWPHLISRLTLS